MATNPRRIFNLPPQPETYVEVDPHPKYIISNQELLTKCGWSPFAGMTVTGRIQRVVMRGKTVFDASRPGKYEKILAQPGSGRILS